MEKIKVLIVEDNYELASMYKIKFEKEGFETIIAEDGFSAIAKVGEFNPNAILLDIMMPNMDGFETLSAIRRLAPSLTCKIIMFSNLNRKEDIEKSLSLGADDYLLKASTTPKDAVEKIRNLLGGEKNCSSLNINTCSTCPHCGNNINISINITK